MNPVLNRWLALIPLLAAIATMAAQNSAPSVSPQLIAQLLNLAFGSHTAFTAVAELRLDDPQFPVTAQAGICRDQNRYRLFLDAGKMQSRQFHAGYLGMLQRLGVDRTIQIIRFDQNRIWNLYPQLQAYYEQPLTGVAAAPTPLRFAKTRLGEESVGSRPCVQWLVTASDQDKSYKVGTLWLSKEEQDFPRQAELDFGTGKLRLTFQTFKTGPVDGHLFDPPAGWKKYNTLEEIVAANAARRPPPIRTPSSPKTPPPR